MYDHHHITKRGEEIGLPSSFSTASGVEIQIVIKTPLKSPLAHSAIANYTKLQ